MSPPTYSPAPATTAAALHLAHGNLYAALGAVCVLAWFVTHRFAAHRHPIAEWIAKVFLVAGGVVLAVSIGAVAKWIGNANALTARWLSAWTGDPTFTAKGWGALTVLAVIDVVFVASTTYDLLRQLSAKKSGAAGGPARTTHPRWGALEAMANKYGWFGLGPLAVTLPAPFGLWVVGLLTLLSEYVSHLLGHLFGMG